MSINNNNNNEYTKTTIHIPNNIIVAKNIEMRVAYST